MKAKEVMKVLKICRGTLYNYLKENKIKAIKLNNGYFDYDEKSVYNLLKIDNRQEIIYARVSTHKQKNDLIDQINKIQVHCINNKIKIDTVYSEIASGIDLDRIEFSKLLDDVFNYKIKSIYISNKDRLTRLSFKTLESVFKRFNTKVIVINQNNSNSNDNEIFEELISLMHIFSTSLYSNRRKNKINIYKSDIENFISDEK